jgi:hypothetical protein
VLLGYERIDPWELLKFVVSNTSVSPRKKLIQLERSQVSKRSKI